MMIFEDKRTRPHFDFFLLLLAYALMIFGVLAISIATYDPAMQADSLLNHILNSDTGSWQAIFVIASPAIVWFVVSVPYEHFRTYAVLYYAAVTLLLMFVLLVSTAIREVKGWFEVGLGRMLQPSEFAKLTLILMLARELAITEKPMGSIRSVLRIGVFSALPIVLTLAQNETGTVLVMAGIVYLMLVFGGVDWKWILSISVLAALAIGAIFAYGIIGDSTDYRILRLISFLDPQAYEGSAGYQIINSQQAIGSGGLTGIGAFVPGSMSQLNYVPEDWTDFIFATIGEAVGFVGCALIVLVYLLLILRMLYLSRFTADKFGRLVIIGVMAMLFLHVFQNIAMTLGLMPITGIPLPFLSYGGSNLVTNVVGISLVLNVTRNRSSAMPAYATPAAKAAGIRRRRKKQSIYVNSAQDEGLRKRVRALRGKRNKKTA